ncbi:hypothetical protein LVJ94_29595 [Pendulispora rubella]|uniref:Histidine kinase/HSP90-like ATPase domain-containing protein n=1 Tax=Pendulispora rubella TaxID=2741070 RepID=A0ABZ2KXP2_9BACT
MRAVALEIPHLWKFVSHARAEVERALTTFTPSVRAATVMTASELIENAMKYGEEVPGLLTIHLRLQADTDRITIEVANGALTRERVHQLEERLDEIAASTNREELYMNRIRTLLENPAEKGGLGLYRIGFEGGFDLTCTFTDSIVTVTAVRGVHEHGNV